MKKILSLILTILCFSGCDDDGELPTYFDIEVAGNYNENAVENWVILHDEEGNTIDAKSFVAGDHVVFRAGTAPARLSVTILSYFGDQRYSMQTYHGEQSSSTWTLRGPSQLNAGAPTASMEVRVSDPNLGHPFDAAISDGTGLELGVSESIVDFVQTIPAPHANLNYFISVTDKSGTPLYKFLDQPVAGTLNYTLNDFNTYDQTSFITFPQTSGYLSYVLAFEEGAFPDAGKIGFGYMTNLRWSGMFTGTPATSARLGFLNQFPNYFIFATGSYGDYSLNHESFGPAPQSLISIPNDINVTTTDNTWDGYAVSSTDYHWYSAQYNSEIVTSNGDVYRSWIVRGANTNFKNLKELPPAVQSAFPDLSIDDFTYAISSFYKSTRTYDDYLTHTFKGGWGEAYSDHYKALY